MTDQLLIRARLLAPKYRAPAKRIRALSAHTKRYAYELIGDRDHMVKLLLDDDGRWSITRVDPRTGNPLPGQ